MKIVVLTRRISTTITCTNIWCDAQSTVLYSTESVGIWLLPVIKRTSLTITSTIKTTASNTNSGVKHSPWEIFTLSVSKLELQNWTDFFLHLIHNFKKACDLLVIFATTPQCDIFCFDRIKKYISMHFKPIGII